MKLFSLLLSHHYYTILQKKHYRVHNFEKETIGLSPNGYTCRQHSHRYTCSAEAFTSPSKNYCPNSFLKNQLPSRICPLGILPMQNDIHPRLLIVALFIIVKH